MLVSLIAVAQYVPEQVSLMSAMTHVSENMPKNQQVWAFLGFLIGFGVKMPIFPLHGWLPPTHVEAPSPVSIIMSGILIKMGAYGLLRVELCDIWQGKIKKTRGLYHITRPI